MYLLLLLACTGKPAEDEPAPDDTGADDSDTGEIVAPPAPSDDWCARVIGGPAGEGTLAELSAVHARHRFFGVDGTWELVDAGLARMLLSEDGLTAPDWSLYTQGLPGVCAVPAEGPLGPASVEQVGGLAVIHPGTGTVTVPEGTTAVALDLRGLPADPALPDALAAAYAAAAASSQVRLERKLRSWSGFVDQVYSSTNVYTTDTVTAEPEPWPGAAASDLPLAVLTDDKLAPAAAELAISVRVLGRGWLVGEDVPSAVAESTAMPVGDTSVVVVDRAYRLLDEQLPDTIPADLRAADPVAAVAGLADWGSPGGWVNNGAKRPTVRRLDPWRETPDPVLSLGTARAGLLIQHGTWRSFYPYFEVVGDGLDARLEEVMAGLDATNAADREAHLRRVGRLGNVLSDGHNFSGDFDRAAAAGCLLADWDELGGEPVVEHSDVPELPPGTTLLAVGGVPAAEWFADMESVVGGATEGYRFNIASRSLVEMDGPTDYEVRDPDGAERTVTVEPAACSSFALPWGYTTRPNGFLDGEDADLYFFNAGDDVTRNDDEMEAALTEAAGAAGLILDMRGYPAVNHYALAQRLNTEAFTSPLFLTPTWEGPDGYSRPEDSYPLEPVDSPRYDGPIVLLVGPRTVSAAENFAIMLVGAHRVTVVGRNSAGTNGNITGMSLPGGFYASFTGMEVLYPDGSTFHGVGIVPDVEVEPTAADYAAGRDVELEAAIEVLRGG